MTSLGITLHFWHNSSVPSSLLTWSPKYKVCIRQLLPWNPRTIMVFRSSFSNWDLPQLGGEEAIKTTEKWRFSFNICKGYLLYMRLWGKDCCTECRVPVIYRLGFSLLQLNYTQKSLFRTASRKMKENLVMKKGFGKNTSRALQEASRSSCLGNVFLPGSSEVNSLFLFALCSLGWSQCRAEHPACTKAAVWP